MTYKQSVAAHIQPLLDDGRSQGQVARLLNIERNMLSNVMSPRDPSRLAISRLRTLQQVTGFSDIEALKLVMQHAREYDGCKVDPEAIKWLIHCSVGAYRSCATSPPAAAGGVHA